MVSIYINQTLEDEGNISITSGISQNSHQTRDLKSSAGNSKQRVDTPKSCEHDGNNNDNEIVDHKETANEDLRRGETEGDWLSGPDGHGRMRNSQSAKSSVSTTSRHTGHVLDDDNDDTGVQSNLSEQYRSHEEFSEDDEDTLIDCGNSRVLGIERKQLGNHIRQLGR